MEDFAQRNPDQIKQELDSISEEMAEALYSLDVAKNLKKLHLVK